MQWNPTDFIRGNISEIIIDDNMKLIILQPYLNIKGGAERVILEIARHYNAKILTMEYNKNTTYSEFSECDIQLIGKKVPLSELLPYRASQGLRYGYNFYNFKIKEEYDVLNSHISPSEWIRHKNTNVLWYCHTPPREVYDLYSTRMKNRTQKEKILYSSMAHIYRLIAKRTVKKIENIATNSKNTSTRIEKYFSRSSTIIPPGIEYSNYENKSDEHFFFYPSRFIINKQQDYVIRAFKVFCSKRKDNKYSLILAGTLSNDPEHLKYMEYLKTLSSGLRVKILTNVDEERLRNLYSTASAVLFAAKNEDYGLVPLEAMASSKPIIALNDGGPTETVIDGKTGYLINSELEMAEKMFILSKNPTLSEALGKAGRKHIIKNYSWKSFFKKLDILLEKTKNSNTA